MQRVPGIQERPRKVSQPPNNDTVDDIQNLILERLELWKTRKRNELPTKILINRSGLSSANHTTIPGKKLCLIESAYKPMYEREHRPLPKISYTACGIGDHTRFYPTQDGGMNNDYHKLSTVIVVPRPRNAGGTSSSLRKVAIGALLSRLIMLSSRKGSALALMD